MAGNGVGNQGARARDQHIAHAAIPTETGTGVFIEGEVHTGCLAGFERDAVCSSRHRRGGRVIHHEGHTA